jgi:peptidyl-prolyl cis-trans isomerase D
MIRFLQTPGPIKKIVLGGILLFIAAAMVITLIPGGFLSDSGATQGTLVKVGGQDVTTVEVQQAARQIARQQFPRGFPPELQPYLMQSAANNLIMQKAFQAEANRLGLKVTDAELRDELEHGPMGKQLFPNGQFIGREAYENFVAQNFSLGISQFEQLLKADLQMRKLQGTISASVAVSDADVQKEFQRQNTKVKFDYAMLTMDDVMKQIHPSDAELRAFYDKVKQRYANALPERRKVKYALVDNSKILEQVKAQLKPEDEQKYYNDHKDDYRVPEQVKVSHILIRTPAPGTDGKVDENAVQAAKSKAEDILKKLRAGANFAEVAKKESQDPGSAKQGGSLGAIERGRTVAEFENAAFTQPVGKIGDLVKTSFGFHIIRVDEKQEAHLKPFAEVKDSIATRLAQDKAAATSEALANKLLIQARTLGIDKAAADNQLPVVTTDWFKKADSLPGLGPSPEFMNVAFTEHQNGPPEMAKLPQGYAILLVTEVKPASTPTFEEHRAVVEGEFKQERANAMLGQKTQELADRAHVEHDLKKAAKELGGTVKSSELVTPANQVPDLGAMSSGPAAVAFDLKQGEISGPLHITQGGAGAVLQVTQKQEASPEEFTKSKDQIREQLAERKRNERLQLFVANLRTRMEKEGKIKINKDEWTKVMGKAPEAT